jgi:hypothetical protein
MLMGRLLRRPTETLLQEIIDVLNPSTHVSPKVIQRSPLLTTALTTAEFIACKGLSQDYYQRCIARKVNNVSSPFDAAGNGAVYDVQPCEGFT